MERVKGGWRMMLRVDRRFVHDGHGHAEDESVVPEDGVSLSPAPKGAGDGSRMDARGFENAEVDAARASGTPLPPEEMDETAPPVGGRAG